ERVHVRRIEQVVHGEAGGDGEVGTLERGGNGKPPRRVGVRRYLLRQRGAVLPGDERGAEARLDVARRAEGIDPVLHSDLEAIQRRGRGTQGRGSPVSRLGTRAPAPAGRRPRPWKTWGSAPSRGSAPARRAPACAES